MNVETSVAVSMSNAGLLFTNLNCSEQLSRPLDLWQIFIALTWNSSFIYVLLHTIVLLDHLVSLSV